MIKLTKIVLINWMYFQKTTLPLEGNSVIVGVNGTGKSTIIDAIQMLLLGNKASKFNANANAEKRSLESYVRGAVSTQEKDYLRPGDVITYLALEINLNGNKHIFGININYKYERSDLSDPKYFYISGVDLSEDMFVKNNYPKTYDELTKDFKLIHISTLFQYQIKLRDILGLKDHKKYFQILSRAVGIKNINNCNDFMNEFVLDDNPIDVETIKNNILEMEKVNKTIEREQEKLDALTEIVTTGEEISNNEIEMNNKTIKRSLASIILDELEIDKLSQTNKNLKNKENELKVFKDNLEEEITNQKDSKRELENSLKQLSPDLEIKRKELANLNKEYDEVHFTLNTFREKCKNEVSNLSLLSKYKKAEFDNLYQYIISDEYTSSKTLELFNEFRNAANSLKVENDHSAIRLETSVKEIRDKLVELKDIIDKLKKNKLTYSSNLENFRNYIKSSLEDKHKESIEVKFLCEYLDVTDKEWQRAIEGYLNTQRFYIVVPNKYYKEALKLYDSKKDFCATRIINGTRIPDMDFEENTLGSFIESSNSTALNYTRYILNRVHCASDIYDLENYDIAVTKDCMHYQNYSVGRLNIRACDEQYIGLSGIKTQLEQRQKMYNDLNDEAIKLRNEIYKYRDVVNNMKNAISFASKIIENNSLINSIDEDLKLFDKIQNLTEDIKFFESKPEYIEISDKIAKIEKIINENNIKLNNCSNELIKIGSQIIANEKSIANKVEELNNKKELVKKYDVDIVEKQRFLLSQEKVSYSSVSSLDSDIRKLERLITQQVSNIEYLMRSVRDNFNVNYEPKYEQINKYIDERNNINQSVFKYNSKLIDFKKNNRKLFFSQFLSKLYKAIEKARTDIDNLNHSLQVFDFGKDYYRIKMGVTEHPDFRLIYEYAKKYNADDSDRGLFIDQDAEDRERSKIQDILNEYMFSTDISLNNMIVDYRKYLLFDVEVHTPNGVKSLNKVMRSQSGGEVQVPFYILSGVAFQQTLDYKRNKDALGIVLYDEAFDKMDSQRIQSMLQFYRDKLNLQLVLATPGKLDSLVDNIETILAVVRDGENAIVSDISHEI